MRTKKNLPINKGVAKVPTMIQMEELECGATCITMILAYFGKWLPPEKVRADCAVCRDGVNAGNMVKAARSYGLEAHGYRAEIENLKSGPFPCIIHWNFNHFVVLDGFTLKGEPVLNDPARGRIKISMKELEECYTGVQICLEPSDNFVASGAPKSVFAFAKKRLRGTASAFLFVMLTGIISSLFGIIIPGFKRVFIDRLLSGQSENWIVPFLVLLLTIEILQFIVSCFETSSNLRINGKFDVVSNSSFMWKLLHLPMEFFSQRSPSDLLNRQSSNASVASTLINILSPLLLKVFLAIFYLVVMIRYSVTLSIIGILSIFINLITSKIISSYHTDKERVQMRNSAKLSNATMQSVSMIETIKASGAENGFFAKWSGYQASDNALNMVQAKGESLLSLIPGCFNTICSTAILIVGVYFIIQGEFTYGMVMAFQGYLSGFTSPTVALIDSRFQIQQMRTKMERIDDVMEYPTDKIYDSDVEIDSNKKLSGKIEIKNLTFGYNKLRDPLIKDFNLTIKPGQKIALVGTSGCGKSTVSKLISGLYEPWSGEILFDDKKISEINRRIFTSSLGIVDQDIVLFADTIANNIKMWDESIDDNTMIQAAKDAQIHDKIMEREDAYDHVLLENGANFSGGERQRLEIARVLAEEPSIMILDEATSALDAVTEYNVVNAIRNRGITCIVVAHRLSTIRDCDEILVLDKGEVVERGTHDELYALNGYYKRLVTNE